jgi:hypothetical protein
MRARGDAGTAECLEKRHDHIGALEEQARAKHAALREASFDGGSEAQKLWAELDGLVTDAQRPECSGAYTLDQELVSGQLRATSSVMYAVSRSSRTRGLTASASIAASVRRAPPPASTPRPPPPAPPPPAAPAAPAAQRERPHDATLLLRSARLTLAVYEVEKRMDAASALAAELGGYLAIRAEHELTVRVPREHFDEALARLSKLGDVLHRSVVAEDVTDQHVDLELRLKNAQAVRARLEKLLEQASVRDAVEIHKELAKITDEIERLEGKLKLLNDRLAFSTIAIRFEHLEAQRVRTQALLPFPWMRVMGLKPVLEVSR